jgi:2-oxoglutarate ferredoxin oxidoreductase subunit delta
MNFGYLLRLLDLFPSDVQRSDQSLRKLGPVSNEFFIKERQAMIGKSSSSSCYRVCVIAERCKECGFCIAFCPQRILYRSAETNGKGYHIACIDDSDNCPGCNVSGCSPYCTGCDTCSMICPEFAISVVSVD